MTQDVCVDPDEIAWLRAVDLGARGRYLAAWRWLDRIGPRSAWASLGHSTRASHLRQVGAIEQAHVFDDLAVATAQDEQSAADAWIGLAADAIAAGDALTAAAHVERARVQYPLARDGDAFDSTQIDSPSIAVRQPWRIATRAAWVRAELALMRDDAQTAAREATVAIQMSASRSARHRLKSEAIHAAACVGLGQGAEVIRTCTRLAQQAQASGWVTLLWPLGLIGLAAGHGSLDLRVPDVVIAQAAWATRLIEAHLPEDPRFIRRPGSGVSPDVSLDGASAVSLVARWREREDVQRLRAVAGR